MAQAEPTVLQTLPRNTVTSTNAAGTGRLRTHLAQFAANAMQVKYGRLLSSTMDRAAYMPDTWLTSHASMAVRAARSHMS